MATRPVYIPQPNGDLLVKTEMIDFEWFPGMSKSQKQKSIAALHASAQQQLNLGDVLEVSSKSTCTLGNALSAFNLMIKGSSSHRQFSVECAYQAAKVFEHGGPYSDLLGKSSREAKKDARLKTSGRLTGFLSNGEQWPLEPKTVYYDWLYINALKLQPALAVDLQSFDAFTDIEFNPKKSLNCQAYSVALFRALEVRGQLDSLTQTSAEFIAKMSQLPVSDAISDASIQPEFAW